MTERERLQIEYDLLIDDINRIEKQIEAIDLHKSKEYLNTFVDKCFKDDDKEHTAYYCFNNVTFSEYNEFVINYIEVITDNNFLFTYYFNKSRFNYHLESFSEISKEEFTNEYTKVINHYNTLINGTKTSI